MLLRVLDTGFKPIAIIDDYISVVWTERYNECGDFELEISATSPTASIIQQDLYLQCDESEYIMIIEKIKTVKKSESDKILTISGRSLESILTRRIVINPKFTSGVPMLYLQLAVEDYLNANIIQPLDIYRRIPEFIFEESPDLVNLDGTIVLYDEGFKGSELYAVINTWCREKGIGFKITLNSDNNMAFKLYKGINRSYDREYAWISPVVFSPNFDNVANVEYLESKSASKNVAFVYGGEKNTDIKYITISTDDDGDNVSGYFAAINRREIGVDASDITMDDGDGDDETSIFETKYMQLLESRGRQVLTENTEVFSFDCELDYSIQYRYGEHFYMGDIVQVDDGLNHGKKVRVTEVIRSYDSSGTMSVYPGFTELEKGSVVV